MMRHRDLVKSQLFRAARAPVDNRLEVKCLMASVLVCQGTNIVYSKHNLRWGKIDMVTMVRGADDLQAAKDLDVDSID